MCTPRLPECTLSSALRPSRLPQTSWLAQSLRVRTTAEERRGSAAVSWLSREDEPRWLVLHNPAVPPPFLTPRSPTIVSVTIATQPNTPEGHHCIPAPQPQPWHLLAAGSCNLQHPLFFPSWRSLSSSPTPGPPCPIALTSSEELWGHHRYADLSWSGLPFPAVYIL